MATTKKPRKKKAAASKPRSKVVASKPRSKKVVASEPAAAKVDEPEATSEAKKPSIEPEVVEAKRVPKKKIARSIGRVFHIHLIEGASLSSRGFNFVAGRPLVTSDEKIFKLFEFNGRFRIDVREGGAK